MGSLWIRPRPAFCRRCHSCTRSFQRSVCVRACTSLAFDVRHLFLERAAGPCLSPTSQEGSVLRCWSAASDGNGNEAKKSRKHFFRNKFLLLGYGSFGIHDGDTKKKNHDFASSHRWVSSFSVDEFVPWFRNDERMDRLVFIYF